MVRQTNEDKETRTVKKGFGKKETGKIFENLTYFLKFGNYCRQGEGGKGAKQSEDDHTTLTCILHINYMLKSAINFISYYKSTNTHYQIIKRL